MRGSRSQFSGPDQNEVNGFADIGIGKWFTPDVRLAAMAHAQDHSGHRNLGAALSP